MNDQQKSSRSNKRIGLALSGGGYRAAAFHLGTLRKLNNLGILDKVDVISTISGGSIIGAYYALHREGFNMFVRDFSMLLKKSVIKRVLLSATFIRMTIIAILMILLMLYFLFFTPFPWACLLVLITCIFIIFKFQFELFPVSKLIEKIYQDIFFKNATLDQFPDKPIMAVSASNLQTGRLFTFSKSRMGDSTYTNEEAQFNPSWFPVARAVMASSCVPFAFTPVSVSQKYYQKSAKGAYVRPLLIDGGVYDNQGIHKLTHMSNPPAYLNDYECDYIISSDAGNKMSFGRSYHNVLTLLSRTCDLFMNRIKMLQIMQNLYQNQAGNDKEIAYISLGWDIDKCIPGFVRNLREGKISDSVREAHGLNDRFIDKNDDEAIIEYMKRRIDYTHIMLHNVSDEDLKIARSVSTNLTSLSNNKILALSEFAEIQTELQVKLYCPSIL